MAIDSLYSASPTGIEPVTSSTFWLRSFTTLSFDSFYWVPSFGIWLRGFDQAPAYRELREWLQVLQWQDPSRSGKKWVLKSPHHLTAVETVLLQFPDCKIVMTHRAVTSPTPRSRRNCRRVDLARAAGPGHWYRGRYGARCLRVVRPRGGTAARLAEDTRFELVRVLTQHAFQICYRLFRFDRPRP